MSLLVKALHKAKSGDHTATAAIETELDETDQQESDLTSSDQSQHGDSCDESRAFSVSAEDDLEVDNVELEAIERECSLTDEYIERLSLEISEIEDGAENAEESSGDETAIDHEEKPESVAVEQAADHHSDADSVNHEFASNQKSEEGDSERVAEAAIEHRPESESPSVEDTLSLIHI